MKKRIEEYFKKQRYRAASVPHIFWTSKSSA